MQPLLRVKNLTVHFDHPHSNVAILHNVCFDLQAGKTLALVGESGSGKTMTALALLGLLPKRAQQTSGEIWFGGKKITREGNQSFEKLRGKQIAMIFQEPGAALNPVFRVGGQIKDVIRTHLGCSSKTAKTRTIELLRTVGFVAPHVIYKAYPHQLSGGMAQRVMIAMALSCNPNLIIADEPTTALDVITQKQILKLIADLQEEHQFALLLISHDIKVVAALADSVVVMHHGKIVERGQTKQVLCHAREPYTRNLINSSKYLPNRSIQTKTYAEAVDPS